MDGKCDDSGFLLFFARRDSHHHHEGPIERLTLQTAQHNQKKNSITMPVPKRRQSKGFSPWKYCRLMFSKVLDINFIFQQSRVALFYAFTPAVLCIGMLTEPFPASWFDIINILE
jgi:hypothetical protein